MLVRGLRAITSILCLLSVIMLANVVLIMEPTHLDGYIPNVGGKLILVNMDAEM
jgi:hypothetical protein